MGRKSKEELAREFETSQYFREEIVKYARNCIEKYFEHKEVNDRASLNSEESVRLLMKANYENGFEYAHKHLLPKIKRPAKWREPTMKWEVYCLLKILEDMRFYNVPKVFQPGMTLLFFKYCKGMEIPSSNFFTVPLT